VGSLTGALLSTRRSVRPRQTFLVVSAVAFGVLSVVAGLMPSYVSFAVLLVPTGAAALIFSVANNSFVQMGVDPQMRGRVMALYFMCFMGGTPVGAPLIGLISQALRAPWGVVSGAAGRVPPRQGGGAGGRAGRSGPRAGRRAAAEPATTGFPGVPSRHPSVGVC